MRGLRTKTSQEEVNLDTSLGSQGLDKKVDGFVRMDLGGQLDRDRRKHVSKQLGKFQNMFANLIYMCVDVCMSGYFCRSVDGRVHGRKTAEYTDR